MISPDKRGIMCGLGWTYGTRLKINNKADAWSNAPALVSTAQRAKTHVQYTYNTTRWRWFDWKTRSPGSARLGHLVGREGKDQTLYNRLKGLSLGKQCYIHSPFIHLLKGRGMQLVIYLFVSLFRPVSDSCTQTDLSAHSHQQSHTSRGYRTPAFALFTWVSLFIFITSSSLLSPFITSVFGCLLQSDVLLQTFSYQHIHFTLCQILISFNSFCLVFCGRDQHDLLYFFLFPRHCRLLQYLQRHV